MLANRLHLRAANQADLEQVARRWGEYLSDQADRQGAALASGFAGSLTEWVTKRGKCVLATDENGRIIGEISWRLIDLDYAEGQPVLDWVYVDPEHRSQGIADHLVKIVVGDRIKQGWATFVTGSLIHPPVSALSERWSLAWTPWLLCEQLLRPLDKLERSREGRIRVPRLNDDAEKNLW